MYVTIKQRVLKYAFVGFLTGMPLQMIAQQQRVTLKLNHVSLKEALSKIEKKTQYKFSYRDVMFDKGGPVTYQGSNVTVASVLSEILSKYGLKYQLVEPSTIIITSKASQLPKAKKTVKTKGIVLDPQKIHNSRQGDR